MPTSAARATAITSPRPCCRKNRTRRDRSAVFPQPSSRHSSWPRCAITSTPAARGEQLPDNDRDLVERHVERVTLTANHVELRLRQIVEQAQELDAHDGASTSQPAISTIKTIAIPWTSPVPAAVKGIIHVPAHNTPIKPGRREALLIAIAKARNWINDLAHGRVASFAAIARREGKGERHIRLLAPLAFLSPRIVSALLDGTAPADLTVMALVRALPYSWTEQERRVGTKNFTSGPK